MIRRRLPDPIRRTDWLWLLLGGSYLLASLSRYGDALAALPESLRDPPEPYSRGWPVDFAVTALAAAVLVSLGVRRAPGGTRGRRERRVRWSYRSTEDAMQ